MDEIREFTKKYSYNFEHRHFFLLDNLWNYHHEGESDKRFFPNTKLLYYEMICFIDILNKARKTGGGIHIKYKNTSMDMKNIDNIDYLLEKMNEVLICNRHEDYMEVFGWGERKEVLPNRITKWENSMDDAEYEKFVTSIFSDSCIEEPYNIEEVKKIIIYEKTQMESFNIVMRERLSFYLNMIVYDFKKEGIFQHNKKTIATEDACFLYDLLCMIGIWEYDETKNNPEKYLKIKNELKRYRNIDLHRDLKLLIP